MTHPWVKLASDNAPLARQVVIDYHDATMAYDVAEMSQCSQLRTGPDGEAGLHDEVARNLRGQIDRATGESRPLPDHLARAAAAALEARVVVEVVEALLRWETAQRAKKAPTADPPRELFSGARKRASDELTAKLREAIGA